MKMKSALLAVLLLAGCAPTDVPTPPQPGTTTSATGATTEPALSFEDVAIASCDLAIQVGVEEAATSGYRQVMIPKSEALDGYSAAWEDPTTGEIGLIWETDSFLSCSAAMTIWLAAEAGEQPIWEINETQDGFELFQDFGDFGTQTVGFAVENGVFSSAQIDAGEVFVISYQPEIPAAQELIAAAVKEFEE